MRAIEASATKGGDGIPTTFDMRAAAANDIAGNNVSAVSSLRITEIADTKLPFLRNVTVNYSNGIVNMHFSETIDVTPLSRVDFSRLRILDFSGINTANKFVDFVGSTILHSDSPVLVINLPESKRASCITFSEPQVVIKNPQLSIYMEEL